MKKTGNDKSSIYEYLEPFLESGNSEAITKARKEYWRIYKAEWRKAKRQKESEFTISLTDKELKIIEQGANKHNRSITKFIKESSIAFCSKKFLFPEPASLNQIRELLALNYNAVQQLSEDEILSEYEGQIMLKQMAELEEKVLTILNNPNPLTEAENLTV